MTALIIIGSVILLFVLLLNVKIRAEVRYIGGNLDFKVKYLFFTIFPFKEKKKKPKKIKKRGSEKKKSLKSRDPAEKNKTARKNVRSSSKDSEPDFDEELLDPGPDKLKKEKKSLSERLGRIGEIIEKVQIIWGFTQKGLKRLFGHIRIDGLMIDFSIAGDDAYSTALNYGRICAVTYNAIGFVQAFFRTNVKTVDIVCDFNGKKSVYDCCAKITLTPSTILSAAFILFFGFLRNFRKILGKTKSKNQPDPQKAVTV